MQLGLAADDSRKRWEHRAAARGDRAARRTAAWRERAGGHERRRRHAARAGRGAALRRRPLDGLHRRSLVALAHDAAGDRSLVRHVLAAGGALARASRDRSRRDRPCRRARRRATRCRFSVAVRNAAFEPLRDATVDVRVTAPDGRLEYAPGGADPEAPGAGRYVARFTAGDAGRLPCRRRRAGASGRALGSASASVLVGGADLEMTDPRLNARCSQRLAAASGGQRRAARRTSRDVVSALLRRAVPAAALAVRRDLWHNGWSFAAITADCSAPNGSCGGAGGCDDSVVLRAPGSLLVVR